MVGDEIKTTATRTRRRLGWMAAATLTVGALFAPAAAFADHTMPIDLGESGTDQSGLCEGDYFKIESTGSLVEGEHTYSGTTAEGVAFTVTLDVTLDEDNEVDTITIVSSSLDIEFSVIKAGTEFFIVMGNTLVAENAMAISNVAFCLGETMTTTSSSVSETTETTDTETTETETTETTETETTETETSTVTETETSTATTTEVSATTSTATETETSTATETETSTATETETSTATQTNTGGVSPTTSTSTGNVSGTVGGPAPTLPPTSTDGAETGTSSTISFALLILAAASLALVMARPLATSKNNR